jgi:prepilin peptidase CpaA
MPLTAAAVFLAALILPCLWAAWSDLRTMTIPNRLVLITAALFLATGPFLLPLEDVLWRLLAAAAVLVIGFLLNLTGQFGAGDAKFAAAIGLFVAPERSHLAAILVIYAALALVSVAILTLVKRSMPARAAASSYRSLRERGRFPLGLPLALSILGYLALVIASHLSRS